MAEPQTAILPGRISGRLTNVRITKSGRKIFGMPVTPRAAKGYRRHVRRVKAKRGAE